MHKIILIISLVVTSFSGPKSVLSDYIFALKNLDFKLMYSVISKESKKGLTLNEYIDQKRTTSNIFFALIKRSKFEIVELIENDSIAIGIVKIEAPNYLNMPSVYEDVNPLIESNNTSSIMTIDFDSLFQVNYPNNEYPTLIKLDTVTLVLEGNVWKVDTSKL